MHRGSIHQRHPKAPFKSKPCGFDCYTVLAPVSKCYPLLMGRLPTCYSPVRHSSFSGGASSGGKRSVRLACIRHAASVRPEPGSNSHFPSWKWAFYRLALKLSLSYLKFIACELTSLLFGIFYIPHTFSETLFSFQGTTVAVWQLLYYIMSLELWQVIFLAPHLSQMTAL